LLFFGVTQETFAKVLRTRVNSIKKKFTRPAFLANCQMR